MARYNYWYGLLDSYEAELRALLEMLEEVERVEKKEISPYSFRGIGDIIVTKAVGHR